MQINPGGRLNTKDVTGRDGEIARYWRVLERQGLVISAERRIGKTHIVLKTSTRSDGHETRLPAQLTLQPGKHGPRVSWRPSSSGVAMSWTTCCPASPRRYEARRNTAFS